MAERAVSDVIGEHGYPVTNGHCSLCDVDVPDLWGHHLLHFEQWDVEGVVAFMADVHPNVVHSRRLVHPLWKDKANA